MSGFYEGILLCRKKEIGVFSVKFWRALHVLPLQEFKIQYTVSAPRNDQIVYSICLLRLFKQKSCV